MSLEWKKVVGFGGVREDYYINGQGPVVRAAPFGWWPLASSATEANPLHYASSMEEAKVLAERAVWEDDS